jgi:polynucleotide 5'-kinase involved in rRNA processing
VNTDGWVNDEEAVNYKAQVAELLQPDVVFCMESIGELPSVCARFGDALGAFRQERIEAPATVKERSREKRRSLRELGYNKYLADAKLKAWSLSRLKLESTDVSSPFAESKASETAKTAIEKKKVIATLSATKGLLLGLVDAHGKFLGIGVSQGIDSEKKTLKVYTAIDREPALVQLGKVQLDRDLHEVTL